ncbi:unnamed protein product [Lactuca virosa]|uniref:Uncharacterized protein n=1 Tax=Lactuca virosa TaxID=75947 RepID=A0AAU9N2X7_9ASTR|nr:unnamed protein product [Lactuca virosa]
MMYHHEELMHEWITCVYTFTCVFTSAHTIYVFVFCFFSFDISTFSTDCLLPYHDRRHSRHGPTLPRLQILVHYIYAVLPQSICFPLIPPPPSPTSVRVRHLISATSSTRVHLLLGTTTVVFRAGDMDFRR